LIIIKNNLSDRVYKQKFLEATMSHAGASSDQLFAKFFQYYKRIEPLVPEELVKGLYNAVDDKKWLESVLSKNSDELIAPRKVDQPNIASFKYSTPAKLWAAALSPKSILN
jgi:hypothetical protein